MSLNIYIMYKLPDPSAEQSDIIDSFKQGFNIQVDSVAGCGKTTTILHCCSATKKKILLLTYNKRLKEECRKKVQSLGLKNVVVHSYHSACYWFYKPGSHHDSDLEETIRKDWEPLLKLDFHVIIMDEQQDMKHLFAVFTKKMIRDNMYVPQLAVFGDVNQNIYGYLGTDSRFLSMAYKIFANDSGFEWKQHKITTSFRINNQMAEFINAHIFGEVKIRAVKDGDPVIYVCIDPFDNQICDHILQLIKRGEFSPQDIFILAPSVRKSWSDNIAPLGQLENRLVENKISVYCTNSDDKYDDGLCSNGKVTISTFHQAKGLERKVVVVLKFDDSYDQYHGGKEESGLNPLYVAISRATDRLYVIHSHSKRDPGGDRGPLGCVDKTRLGDTCTMIRAYGRFNTNPVLKKDRARIVSVTSIVNRLTSKQIELLCRYITIVNVVPGSGACKISGQISVMNESVNKSEYPVLFEEVYSLYGLAVPMYYEHAKTGKIQIVDNIRNVYKPAEGDVLEHKVYSHLHGRISSYLDEEYQILTGIIAGKHYSECNLLFIANLYDAIVEGFINRIKNIQSYHWCDKSGFICGFNNLEKYICDSAEYEKLCVREMPGEQHHILFGYIDITTPDSLWEIKFTSELSDKHRIQLALYSYIADTPLDLKLFNIRTGEIQTLQSKIPDEIVESILRYDSFDRISDEEFLSKYT